MEIESDSSAGVSRMPRGLAVLLRERRRSDRSSSQLLQVSQSGIEERSSARCDAELRPNRRALAPRVRKKRQLFAGGLQLALHVLSELGNLSRTEREANLRNLG
jgi:hypothetical protein